MEPPGSVAAAKALVGRKVHKLFLSEDGDHTEQWFSGEVTTAWRDRSNGCIYYHVM